MSPGKHGPSDVQHQVTTDRRSFENATPEAREQARRETIEAIIDRFPADQRADARKFFQDPRRLAGFSASSDPEIARLLGVLNSIRAAELAPTLDQATADREAARRDADNDVRVLVALVPTLSRPDLRAVVIRRPDDRGQPLLLVREADVTTTDLGRGLRAAAMSVKRYGAVPVKEVRMEFGTFRDTPATLANTTARFLSHVKSSAVQQSIPGVGSVRAYTVIAHVEERKAR